ncbi:MAG: hypothetical protein M3Q40_01625 [Pseudomonadota bacterium]|nr:hypothetical protein [Pseudomonadota bacterium]
MTPPTPRVLPDNQITDDELRAIAYFAIGVGSEGGFAGRDVSHRLSFAGNIRNGQMDPVGNSGYSIGTLQTDLGQHPAVARELVTKFQAWAPQHQPEWQLSEASERQLVADLARDGRAIEASGGRPPDARSMQHLNAFLRSEEGISFVHARDVAQVERLVSGVAPRLQATKLYRESTIDDQFRLASVVMKLQNQSGDRWVPRLLRGMDQGRYPDVDAVNTAIDGLIERTGNGDYVESGRRHTLHALDVLIALRDADARSPLAAAWDAVMADPLVNPTQLDRNPGRPDLPHHYAAVKTLFLQPHQAPALIAALDRGGSYAYGRPQSEGGRAPTAGLYASGDDVVLWTSAGHGVRHITGEWSAVSRADLSRTRHRNGIVDLQDNGDGQTRALMRVDPATPLLRPAAVGPRRVEAQGRHGDSTPATAGLNVQVGAPGHALLQQARSGVHRLDRDLGRTPDDASERMSASLALLARTHGLTRIDHVVLSARTHALGEGAAVFVIQGDLRDPARRVGQMPTVDALQTPAEATLERLAAISNDAAFQPAPAEQVRLEGDPSRLSRS